MYSQPSILGFCIHKFNQPRIENIPPKISRKVWKAKLGSAMCWQLFREHLHCIYNYLNSIIGIIWRRQWQPTPVLLPGKSHGRRSLVGYSPWGHEESTQLSDFTFAFHFHSLEKEMATHSSVLAWRIPGTGEPGGLPSIGSHRVRHNWSDLAAVAAAVSFF